MDQDESKQINRIFNKSKCFLLTKTHGDIGQKKENVAREVSDLTQLKHDGDFQRTRMDRSDITNQDDIHQQ